jgi:Metallo-beta-lactamase superfamily
MARRAQKGAPARRGASPRRVKKKARGRGTVTIRHYCQGIGDCHLIKFIKDDGKNFWMLIDCGVHSSVSGGSDKIAAIVADIAEATDRLDVVVVTHEHWDHVSGFWTERAEFEKFSIGEVWMAWTENPADKQARKLDKFKQQAIAALEMASLRLDGAPKSNSYLSALQKSLDAVVGFNFGAKGEKVRSARDAAAGLAPEKPHYLEPGQDPLRIEGLSNLRIYVLGPPRDPELLKITERASELFEVGGGSGWPFARALSSAFGLGDGILPLATDYLAPFDPNVGTDLLPLVDPSAPPPNEGANGDIAVFVRDHYCGPVKPSEPAGGPSKRRGEPDLNETDQSWRRIDMDWLGVSADLAMQLDDMTNNTSLALAFELTDTGRVLLFVGDAQVGNWLSWQHLAWTIDGRSVTGPDLLARTVYYKVGHHGSHNATLKEKGLKLMTSKDLAAFIPTNEKDAKKVGWGEMPYPKLLNELRERGTGRVIRADDPWVAKANIDISFETPSGSIRGLRHKPSLWVELDIG